MKTKKIIVKLPDKRLTLGEKCGIVGVWTENDLAPQVARRASAALQHRGQESSGITVLKSNGKLKTHIGMGLIPHVLTEKVLLKLGESHMAIAHNRYSTTGESSLRNAQPVTLTRGKYSISLAHNGNIPDTDWIKSSLKKLPKGDSDTVLTTRLLLESRSKFKNWDETLVAVLSKIPGAYCFMIVTEDGNLYGVRDSYGIRPLSLGRRFDGWVMASESVALDVVKASFVREVARGEIVKIDKHGNLSSLFFGEVKHEKRDIFEHIYFARPDSFMHGQRIRAGREESGRRLARRLKKKGIKPDVVVPIFDSGYPAAKGVAEELKIPLVEAITTSHYTGRTFIQPGQERRVAAVNGKHNIAPDGIVGKKIVFVDDSAVRLTTSTILVKGLREAGATAVYAGLASPPVVDRCDMGIDMKSKTELPASQWEKEGLDVIEENAAKLIGAEAVTYLPIEETAASFGSTPDDFYYFPFGGPHPIRGKQPTFETLPEKINPTVRLAVFVSGGGTNLQQIINEIDNKTMDAKIVSVVSNKEDAFALKRAENHSLPTVVLPSKGIMKDENKREEYNKKLLEHIKEVKPHVIVLAGWMVVLSNDFLKAVQKLHIPVVNIHPALLTQEKEDTVSTSRGVVPVLRGMLPDVLAQVQEKKLLVTGVTVHQILPGNEFDHGPILMREEVRTVPDDSVEDLEKRIHDAEYRVFPAALKRLIHVMRQGVDVSDGKFVW